MPSEPGQLLHLPEALHPVARLILDRPDLQQLLGAEREANGFVSALRGATGQNGIALDEDCLRAALRPDPLGLGRFAAAPVAMDRWPGPGWLPARSVPTRAEPAFDWLWFGGGKLTAPFFEDEVRRASAMPLNWLLRTRTSLDDLVTGAAATPGPPLRGLIFHMSRCGSTLLAQMLGAIAGTGVTSEPEPLDAVLRWIAAARPSPEVASAAIRSMTAALGQRLEPSLANHVIKLEVWHSFFLPELRAAFPDTPWIFLHRDPVEVLVSQIGQPGLHVVPGALDETRLGLSGFDAGSQVDFAAQVLGRCTMAVAEHWPLGRGRAIGYPEISAGGALAAAEHFGLSPSLQDAAAMAAAAKRDAKSPNQAFASDTGRKHAEASPSIRAAARQWMEPAYAAIQNP